MSGKVNVERARRMVARAAAASTGSERQRWVANMTPEHRAVHERQHLPGLGCSFCLNETMTRAGETMRRVLQRAGGYTGTEHLGNG